MIMKKSHWRSFFIFLLITLLTACGGDDDDSQNNEQQGDETDRTLVSDAQANGVWNGVFTLNGSLVPARLVIYDGRAWAFYVDGSETVYSAHGEVSESEGVVSASLAVYFDGGIFDRIISIEATVNETGTLSGRIEGDSDSGNVTLVLESFDANIFDGDALFRDWDAIDIEQGFQLGSFSIASNFTSRFTTLDGCDFQVNYQQTPVDGLLSGEFATSGCSIFAPGVYRVILTPGTLVEGELVDLNIGISSSSDAKDGILFVGQ